jgi:hypothetical protein
MMMTWDQAFKNIDDEVARIRATKEFKERNYACLSYEAEVLRKSKTNSIDSGVFFTILRGR